MQTEIEILALCALLEGLIRTLFAEMRLGAGTKEKFPRVQDAFKAVAQKLKIPWKETMEPLFVEWRRARNPSAHGDFPVEIATDSDKQKSVEQMFFGLSRIAGGFNMILLKLFGYLGIYRASALEDKYQRL